MYVTIDCMTLALKRYVGLPDAYSNPEGLPIANMFWLWWIIKAWGFYNFALKR